MNLEMALLLLPGLAAGLTLHEFAHAWMASRLGDDLARRQGRVSLNPLRHLSLVGTLVLLVLPFGWARPVPVNLYNFRRPRVDYLLVSLAGPAANVVVIAAIFLIMQLTRHSYALGYQRSQYMDTAHLVLMLGAFINAVLAVLNLLPIPPLDGSKIWPCIIPGLKPGIKPRTGMLFVVILIVLMGSGRLEPVFDRAIGTVHRMAPVSASQRVGQLAADATDALNAGTYDAAERAVEEIFKIHADSPYGLMLRAQLRLRHGRFKQALADAQRAIEVGGPSKQAVGLRNSIQGWIEHAGQP